MLVLFAVATGASCGVSAQPEQDAIPEPGGARAYGICLAMPRVSGAQSRADLGAAAYRIHVGGLAQDALRHLSHLVPVGQQTQVLSYQIVKRPAHGTLSRDPNGLLGDVRYRPKRGYVGQDTLTALVRLRVPSPADESSMVVYDVSLAYVIQLTSEARADYVAADLAGGSVQKKYCPELMWAVP